MTRRFITPEKLISARFEDKTLIPRWDAAIICFRDRKGSQDLVDAFSGKPYGRKVFWGMEETGELPHVYTADVEGKQIGIVARCMWGAPQAAILVEEIAAMGAKIVIGYGAAGSLDANLKHGEQLVVSCALGTDGTSRYYGEGPFKPEPGMLSLVPSATQVTAATVDAVYRETPDLAIVWKGAGARVVNMESAPFYAAAQACGLRAVWIGHVSDLLVGDWKDWFVERRDMNRTTIENCRAIIKNIDS